MVRVCGRGAGKIEYTDFIALLSMGILGFFPCHSISVVTVLVSYQRHWMRKIKSAKCKLQAIVYVNFV